MAGTPETPGQLYTLDWASEQGYADCKTSNTAPMGWNNNDYLKDADKRHPNGEPAFRMTCSANSEPVRWGGPAARFQLNQGDNEVPSSGNVRAELKSAQFEDLHVERWYAFSIYRKDWDPHVDDNLGQTGEIVSQWHQPADTGGSPPLALMTQNGNWVISLRESYTDATKTGSVDTPLVPYEVGKWTDWVVHVKWSPEANGSIEMWMNGEQLDLTNIPGTTGQNQFAATSPGSWPDPHDPNPAHAKGNYMKFGIYKWGWRPFAGQAEDAGKQRVMFYDSLMISDEANRDVAMRLLGLWNGRRIKAPNDDKVYLIDHGQKRHVVDEATYWALFRDWSGIRQEIDATQVPDGAPLISGSYLAKTATADPIYLIEGNQNVKRWIMNLKTMDKYWFRGDARIVPQDVLDNLKDGPPII